MGDESNEKTEDFEAKMNVLQAMGFIDHEQSLTFKGKVAKIIQSCDSILLTNLVFSNLLEKLQDAEMLALLSVLVEQKPSRKHEMLETEINKDFWNACLQLEKSTQQLIDIEKKYKVRNYEKDPFKRLNYYFYEIVYDWANKKSFLKIKEQNPYLEEGIIIKVVLEVKKICKTISEMAEIMGNKTLGERMERAQTLLEREIIGLQSLYFE